MKDAVIMQLVNIVLMQEKELDELRDKVRRIEEYIEVYENYISGE
jgi:hypothetical protein